MPISIAARTRRRAQTHTLARVRRRARRAGFTLVEVIFAVALLGGVLLGFAVFTRNFVRATNRAGLRAGASDLAVQRIEDAKARGFAAIDSLAGMESNVPVDASDPSSPRFTRQTVVRRITTAVADYKTITVTVSSPILPAAVSKTTSIASF